jgi:hypothetical protein
LVDHGEMLEVLLASSARFRTLVGAADVAAALAFIRQFQAEDTGAAELVYPRAIISEEEEESELVGTATWRRRGALLLALEVQATQATVELQRAWFVALVRAIQSEMETVSASRATPTGYTHSHLVVRRFSWAVPPFLVAQCDREDIDDEAEELPDPLWACQWRVEW